MAGLGRVYRFTCHALSAFWHAASPSRCPRKKRGHPFVPLTVFAAVALSSGQRWSKTGAHTLPLTIASPAASSPLVGRHRVSRLLLRFALMSLMACTFVLIRRVNSGRKPTGKRCLRRSICRGSRAPLRHPLAPGTQCYACRERGRQSRRIACGGHGADAGHTCGMEGIARTASVGQRPFQSA